MEWIYYICKCFWLNVHGVKSTTAKYFVLVIKEKYRQLYMLYINILNSSQLYNSADILSAELPVLKARLPLFVRSLLLYSQDSDSLRASSFMLITVKSSLFLRMLTIDCEIYIFSACIFSLTSLHVSALSCSTQFLSSCWSTICSVLFFSSFMVSCKLTTDQNMTSCWLNGHLHVWPNRYRPGLDSLFDRWAKKKKKKLYRLS